MKKAILILFIMAAVIWSLAGQGTKRQAESVFETHHTTLEGIR